MCLLWFHPVYISCRILFDKFNNWGGKLKKDLQHWKQRKRLMHNDIWCLVYLLLTIKEFRNVFYWRIGKWSKLVFFWLPELRSLHIWTKSCNVGGGLYIGHGWSTVINAKQIGENCLVAQNVTIGSRNMKEPVLEDNVHVWAHAVVLGDITIGANTDIGAGAIVVKSISQNCVVIPESSLIIRKNGNRVKIKI